MDNKVPEKELEGKEFQNFRIKRDLCNAQHGDYN